MARVSLNDIDRRLRMLEKMVHRGYTASPPIPGLAVNESVITDEDGLPAAETAHVMSMPGSHIWLPPLCNVLVVRVKHGQDPVIIAGTGTTAAIAAVQALAVSHPAVATGGLIIADPLSGTCAIVITPTGGDLIGIWKKNGVVIPT